MQGKPHKAFGLSGRRRQGGGRVVFDSGEQRGFVRVAQLHDVAAEAGGGKLPQDAAGRRAARCFQQQKGFDRTRPPQFFLAADAEAVQGLEGGRGEGRGGEHDVSVCAFRRPRAEVRMDVRTV